jgi:hypothetical protein
MRSKQTLEVIDETMLAFTRAEAFELFEGHGLSGELARAAYDRSRGRAGSLAAYATTLSAAEQAVPQGSNLYSQMTPEVFA